MRVIPSHF